jgi:hypothetical protein
MNTSNGQPLHWTPEIAWGLEYLVTPQISGKFPQVADDYGEILMTLYRIWVEIWDVTCDAKDVDSAIRNTFTQNKIFQLFDDAEEAIAFYKTYKIVNYKFILVHLRDTSSLYNKTVKDFIVYITDIVYSSPIVCRQSPYIDLALDCLHQAVIENDITIEVLKRFHCFISNLEEYQDKFSIFLSKKAKNDKISAGKSKANEKGNVQKKEYINEFHDEYEQQHTTEPTLLIKTALNDFCQSKINDTKFQELFLTESRFSRCWQDRGLKSSKNKKRDQKNVEAGARFRLSPEITDSVDKWLHDR